MKKQYIVAASIERVQSFLFDVFQAHEQEKQSDRLTLTKIRSSSTEMSYSFPQLYKKQLANFNPESLPCGSGSVFLKIGLDDNEHKEVYKILDEIYVFFYHHYSGKMRISYGVFDYKKNEISSIRNAEENLRSQQLHNEIILRNQKVLFSFPGNPENPQTSLTLEPIQYDVDECKYYAENLDKLRLDNEVADGRFRVAMIKADFDGMGRMFKELSNFKHYAAVSTTLRKWIRVSTPTGETHSFHAFIRDIVSKKKDAYGENFKIYPLYAAGDDIFIAVHVSNLIRTVFLLREFLEQINNEIKVAGINNLLTMRIGIDITYNSQPIRYYYERADYQMEQVKEDYANEENEELRNALSACPIKLCIDESVFYIPEDKSKSAISNKTNRYMLWDNLQNAIKLIQYIKQQDDAEINSFLYNLLDKVSDPAIRDNPRKLSNAIFYHLRPDFAVATMELMGKAERAKTVLYKKLYDVLKDLEASQDSEAPKKAFKFDDERLVKNFISTLRILLMFSDPRFSAGIKPYKEPDYKNFKKKDTFMKNAKKLINEPKDYMQEKNIPPNLCAIFMPEISLINKSGKKVTYPKPLSLEPAMFYRFKRIMKNDERLSKDNPLAMICDMIESKLNVNIAEVSGSEEQTEHPAVTFDGNAFCTADYDDWDNLFDSLLIFYRYESLQKQWKRTNPIYSITCSKCNKNLFKSYTEKPGQQRYCKDCEKERKEKKKPRDKQSETYKLKCRTCNEEFQSFVKHHKQCKSCYDKNNK